MTKTDIINDMVAHGAVNIKEEPVNGNVDYNGNEIHPIKYRRSIGADQHSEPDTLYVIKQDDGSFVFEKAKPDWMKDSSAPVRQPLASHAQILSLMSSDYQLVSDNSYSIDIREGEDIINARVLDKKDGAVTQKQFSLFDDKGAFVMKEIK